MGGPLGGLILKPTASPIPTDYIAYWPFNGNANDESGNGHDGTVQPGAALVNDRFGNPNSAYYFSGALNSYILVPAFARGSNGMTVSIWIKGGISQLNSPFISHRTTGGVNLNFHFVENNNTGTFILSVGYEDNSGVSVGPGTTLDTSWHHILWTTDGISGNNIDIYIDNTLYASAVLTDNLTDTSQSLAFGRTGQGNFQHWKGSVDDTRYYNRKVTADERTALFNE